MIGTNIERPKKTLSRIKGFSHRSVAGEFRNPDVRRGRKDGKHAPDAWSASLYAIEAEENKFRDDAHSMIKQTQAEAKVRLEHIDNLLQKNKETQEHLKKEERLLPEAVAEVQYSAALFHLAIIFLLTLIDTVGVVYIARQIFSGSVLLFSSIGILLTSSVVFGVKALLEHLAPEKRPFFSRLIMWTGIAFIVSGLVGFAMLRTVTFDAALTGSSLINVDKISYGNLLFTIGLGLGVPFIFGVIFEQESSKMRPAKISRELYMEEKLLLKAKTEWTALTNRLQEIDDKIDAITTHIIKLRQKRYLRGYVKGIRKDPDAPRYIDSILKRGQTAALDSSFTLEPVGTGTN